MTLPPLGLHGQGQELKKSKFSKRVGKKLNTWLYICIYIFFFFIEFYSRRAVYGRSRSVKPESDNECTSQTPVLHVGMFKAK